MRPNLRDVAFFIVVAVTGCAQGQSQQEVIAGEASAKTQGAMLQQLFEKCLTSYGQSYIEARNELLKQEGLKKFIEGRVAGLKKQPDAEAEAVCRYILAWLDHHEAYARILKRDHHYERFGPGSSRARDPGRDIAKPLYESFHKERVSLLVLVESLHKSGEFGSKHGGNTAALWVLTCVHAGKYQWGKVHALEKARKDGVPKELLLSDVEKKTLVRVMNRLVSEGPFQRHRPWCREDRASRFRRNCAVLVEQLKDPSSIPALIQAAIVEQNDLALAALRKALTVCAKSEEGQKLLEAATRRLGAFVKAREPK